MHKPFPVENNHHSNQKADEDDDGDGNEDHGVEDIFISCWVEQFD